MQQLHCEGNWGSVNGEVLAPPATSPSCAGLRAFRVSRWRESLPNFFSADTQLFFISFKSFLPGVGNRRTGGRFVQASATEYAFWPPSPSSVTAARLQRRMKGETTP